MISYVGPKPPLGIHRYTLVLFQQKSRLSAASIELPAKTRETRAEFNTRNFADQHDLGMPVAAAYFNSHKEPNRRRHWSIFHGDECVTIFNLSLIIYACACMWLCSSEHNICTFMLHVSFCICVRLCLPWTGRVCCLHFQSESIYNCIYEQRNGTHIYIYIYKMHHACTEL